MEEITNTYLVIGIPCNFPYTHMSFVDSLMTLQKPTYSYARASGGIGNISDLRNQLVDRALAVDATHLLMLDADMLYPHDMITKLMAHNLDVVTPLMWRRYPPFDPITLRGKVGSYQLYEDWEEGELIEIDATGTGCILYNMDVFKKIPSPWFEFKDDVGEDIGFCIKLRQHGYKIFCDTSVRTSHLTVFEVNEHTRRLYKHMKHLQQQEST